MIHHAAHPHPGLPGASNYGPVAYSRRSHGIPTVQCKPCPSLTRFAQKTQGHVNVAELTFFLNERLKNHYYQLPSGSNLDDRSQQQVFKTLPTRFTSRRWLISNLVSGALVNCLVLIFIVRYRPRRRGLIIAVRRRLIGEHIGHVDWTPISRLHVFQQQVSINPLWFDTVVTMSHRWDWLITDNWLR
jgi:hypothetical protein